VGNIMGVVAGAAGVGEEVDAAVVVAEGADERTREVVAPVSLPMVTLTGRTSMRRRKEASPVLVVGAAGAASESMLVAPASIFEPRPPRDRRDCLLAEV